MIGMKQVAAVVLGGLVVLTGGGAVQAKGTLSSSPATNPQNLRIRHHLRVDGDSDLRGLVRARSGLKVTNSVSTDSLFSTGPVGVGGALTVAGLSTSNGVNAGSGTISTSGALTVGGDTTLGGNLQVGKIITAGGLNVAGGSVQAGSLTTTGTVAAGSITSGGPITANGGINTNGAINASTVNATRLAIASGGTVNFNNASVTGLSGASLSGNVTLSGLLISTITSGGVNGTQALTITQNGQSSSLSVNPTGVLSLAGGGLSTPGLSVAGDATIGGTVNASKVASKDRIQLNAPTVQSSGMFEIAPAGSLQLDGNGGNGGAHLLGNHDTRGQCTASVTADPGAKSCSVTFSQAYSSAPIVVVAPAGTDPTNVTGFSVDAGTGGFTVHFTVQNAGVVRFNYMVQG